jgi:hypothetical protein
MLYEDIDGLEDMLLDVGQIFLFDLFFVVLQQKQFQTDG